MEYTQRIYFNDKPLVLTTDAEGYFDAHPFAETYTQFHGATIRNFSQAIHQLEVPGTSGCVIEDGSTVAIQECLHNLYTPIDAGGGVVFNEEGHVLMIFRRGRWDLPKGKRDEGEAMADCAVREVCEETGLKKVALGAKICDTYHVYGQGNELILKRTSWFHMTASKDERLKPQKEEGIAEARWVSPADMAPLANRSYEAVREVLRSAGVKW